MTPRKQSPRATLAYKWLSGKRVMEFQNVTARFSQMSSSCCTESSSSRIGGSTVGHVDGRASPAPSVVDPCCPKVDNTHHVAGKDRAFSCLHTCSNASCVIHTSNLLFLLHYLLHPTYFDGSRFSIPPFPSAVNPNFLHFIPSVSPTPPPFF